MRESEDEEGYSHFHYGGKSLLSQACLYSGHSLLRLMEIILACLLLFWRLLGWYSERNNCDCKKLKKVVFSWTASTWWHWPRTGPHAWIRACPRCTCGEGGRVPPPPPSWAAGPPSGTETWGRLPELLEKLFPAECLVFCVFYWWENPPIVQKFSTPPPPFGE